MTSTLSSLTCRKCEVEKDISKFKKTKNGHRRVCNVCLYQPYKEQDKDRVKKWRSDNKEHTSKLRRNHRVKQRYTKPWVVAMKSILHGKDHRINIKDSEYTYEEFKIHIESQFDDNMS